MQRPRSRNVCASAAQHPVDVRALSEAVVRPGGSRPPLNGAVDYGQVHDQDKAPDEENR